MADTKVSALTAASALDGSEISHSVQGGADRKVTELQRKIFANTPIFESITANTELDEDHYGKWLMVDGGVDLTLAPAPVGFQSIVIVPVGPAVTLESEALTANARTVVFSHDSNWIVDAGGGSGGGSSLVAPYQPSTFRRIFETSAMIRGEALAAGYIYYMYFQPPRDVTIDRIGVATHYNSGGGGTGCEGRMAIYNVNASDGTMFGSPIVAMDPGDAGFSLAANEAIATGTIASTTLLQGTLYAAALSTGGGVSDPRLFSPPVGTQSQFYALTSHSNQVYYGNKRGLHPYGDPWPTSPNTSPTGVDSMFDITFRVAP